MKKASELFDTAQTAPTCVQCGAEMVMVYGKPDVVAFPYCDNHECPNYSLLQAVIPAPSDV